jgi:hypothetical protein
MLRVRLALVCAVVAADVRAQSLHDVLKRSKEQRKVVGPAERTFTATDLPGPARIDSILGAFVLTEDLIVGHNRAQLGILKARNQAALDEWLMKWKNQTRTDPFGMIDPYSMDKALARVFDLNSITPHDYVFVEVALNRARSDVGESKAVRATLSRPRQANVELVEKHEGNVGPSVDLEREQRILEIHRQSRVKK